MCRQPEERSGTAARLNKGSLAVVELRSDAQGADERSVLGQLCSRERGIAQQTVRRERRAAAVQMPVP